jgi:hypothetical protein
MATPKVNVQEIEKALELIYDYLYESTATVEVELTSLKRQNPEGTSWRIGVSQSLINGIHEPVSFIVDTYRETVEE